MVDWEDVKFKSAVDKELVEVMGLINSGDVDNKDKWLDNMEFFWRQDKLFVDDRVLLMNLRVVIPESMRGQVLQLLHQAHQGVAGMSARARNLVWWPGILVDIEKTGFQCSHCEYNAPSQP